MCSSDLLDDIDGTIYDITDYQNYYNLVSELGAGYKVWVGVDFDQTWNVYRATETDVLITTITRTGSSQLLFTFDKPHGTSAREIIAIKNFDTKEFDGFYIVDAVVDNLNVLVQGYRNLDVFAQLQSVEGSGVYFRLISVRFDKVSDIIKFTPPHGWRNEDRAWIDNDTATNQWGVFQKTDGWKFNKILPLRQGEDRYEEGYGKEVRLSEDNTLILAGTPNYTNGSLSGLRVIDPGADYVSPVVIISPPTGLNGIQADFNVLKDNGSLTKANVLTAGTGYTFAPNVIISDEHNTTTTAATLNDDYIYLASGDMAHVYLGDYVSGQGIPAGTQVSLAPAQNKVKVDAPSYNALNSATNMSIDIGPKTFTTALPAAQTPIVAGSGIRVYVYGDLTKYMEGYVVSFEDNTLEAYFTTKQGSGTFSNWTITFQLSILSGTEVKFFRGSSGRAVAKLTPTEFDYIEVVDGGGGFTLTPAVEIGRAHV